MEDIRILILSAALLLIIGVSGLIATGNFLDINSLTSNFAIIVVGVLLLVVAVYLIYRNEYVFNLKRVFIEKSDEATLAFIRNKLEKIKKYLENKQINKRNAKKVYNELVRELKELQPYKAYISKISNKIIESMNEILSIKRLNSKNVSEFLLATKKLKEELSEI
ncbi:MAG: hypothetical protein QXL82_03265 [Candidatus Aenigmatarchaeota archaeon]